MKNISLILVFWVVLNTASCSQKSLQLNTVLNTTQCGFTQQNLVYIDSDALLKTFFKQSFNNPIQSLEKINFSTSGIILVSMGQQPTTGYSIQLNNSIATINNNILSIDAVLKKPDSNSINAQLITSPCALYKIEKQDISTIKLKY